VKEKFVELLFAAMTMDNARTIACWRYETPYDVYDLKADDLESLLRYLSDPGNGFYSIMDRAGELRGFCSFGSDGQVRGGDYTQEALDIGMGIRPDLTGQGSGTEYAREVLAFAEAAFAPAMFRVTIAAFNTRALRVWQRLEFRPVQSFARNPDGAAFLVLTRKARAGSGGEGHSDGP
jgi:[ribosomal protein S18]-alanine N-acetyltransferase